jgi:hypothetical protein
MDVPVTMRVTEEDCNEGSTRSPTRCPYARACRRLFGPLDLLGISDSEIHLIGGRRIPLSIDSCRRIATFDSGCGMAPHEFTITVPEEYANESSR